MTWVYLDDKFDQHPKVIEAGSEAAWMFVAGLCWVNRNLTNGRIPRNAVRLLTDKRPAPLVKRLLDVRLWEQDGPDYRIHNYEFWNRTAKNLSERGKKGADKRWKTPVEEMPEQMPKHPPSIAEAMPEHSPCADARAGSPTPSPSLVTSPSSEPVLSASPAEVEAAGAELANLRERVFLDNGGKIGNPSGFRRDAQERAVHDIVVWLKANPRGTVDQAVNAVGPVLGARREDPLENTARAQEARIARAKNPCPECINGQVETEAGCIPCPSCNTKAVG